MVLSPIYSKGEVAFNLYISGKIIIAFTLVVIRQMQETR